MQSQLPPLLHEFVGEAEQSMSSLSAGMVDSTSVQLDSLQFLICNVKVFDVIRNKVTQNSNKIQSNDL